MHEISLMKDLLNKIDEIAKENNADTVTQVHVQLGPLAHISADHFAEHFKEFTVNTVAQDAKLTITELDDINHPQAQDITLISLDVA